MEENSASSFVRGTFRKEEGSKWSIGSLQSYQFVGLPRRLGYHRQTPVSLSIHCLNGKDHIVLRDRQGNLGCIGNRLGVLPVGCTGRPPQHLVPSRAPILRSIPGQSGVVSQPLGFQSHI